MRLTSFILFFFFFVFIIFILGYNITDLYSNITRMADIDTSNSSYYNKSVNSIEFDLISDLNVSYEVIKDKANKEVLDTICETYNGTNN